MSPLSFGVSTFAETFNPNTMRYTLSNTINKPLDAVAAKFMEPDGALHWMEGLQRSGHLSGTPGQAGAKTDFFFVHKKKEMKITETILEQNMPHQIKFAYDSSMGYTEVEMLFEKIDHKTTRQTSNSFFDVKGFMKVMGWLFRGMFKKQSMKYMEGFKRYVETAP